MTVQLKQLITFFFQVVLRVTLLFNSCINYQGKGLYEWNTKKQRNSYINKSSLEEEKKINETMRSKTLVLTFK